MIKLLPLTVLLLCAVPADALAAEQATIYAAPKFGDTSTWGRNVQRTMRLLATSTPQKRNTVRVLFYGQSITEQRWWQAVADDLRARFPHANVVIENRALGGFASQLLVKTAETDLYPFYPDLLIFQVYGAHDKYDDIIRRVRERTTAEILQQNEHVTSPADFSEETDPAKLWPPNGRVWGAFMNHNWLPAVSKRYGTELCDQRGLWKRYLTDNGLQPKQLLIDGVHLNAHGEFLMSQCVNAYLRYDPKLGPAAADGWVKTYEVGKDVAWRDGVLRLALEGNRVDVIVKPGMAPPAAVKIDGRRPSEFPELYGFTRTRAKPGGKWPPIAPLRSQKPLVLEDWTMEVVKDRPEPPAYRFTLRGSKTGPDGEGRSDTRFVSPSGRIVIDPEDWDVAFALMLAQVKPVPDRFTVTWGVVPYFVDQFVSPGIADPAIETCVTLAQGLPNARHVLEIAGNEQTPIAAVRVYCPPLTLKSASSSADTQQTATTANSGPASAVVHDLKIFNGEKRLFATYGPSTSVGYPAPLQRKLCRYTGKNATNCPLQIHNYSIGGAQWRMPGWIDCKPSPSDPSQWQAFRSERYSNTILKLIKDNAGTPVIVLAMNNTGYACIPERRILKPDDSEHINMAVNFLRTHARTLLADGAAMYFLSPKKYWRDLDDPHEWNRNEERYAVRKIAAETIPGFVYVKGVWEDTAKYKELALVSDGHHPTHFGDEIIASKFFRALLEHDGLPIPAWDQEEVDAAQKTRLQEMKK